MGENLPARIQYWLTEAKHDCFFIVGLEERPTERIGAMKTLLMGDSEPFRAMLQDSELAETGDIRLKDAEPETFRNFLKCVYGASSLIMPKLTFKECVKLLYVTEKYLVNDVKNELTKHLKNQFSPGEIFVALSHPICYEEKDLQKEIQNYLKLNFSKITEDANFLKLSGGAITWILQQECIYVKEIEIWNAVLQWAKHNSGSSDGKVLQSYVFDLFVYIRFLTMDYNDFGEFVEPSGILLEEEISDICKALVLGKPCSTEYLCKNRSNRYKMEPVSKHTNSSFIEYPQCAFIHCSVSSVSDHQSSYQCTKTYHWAGHLWYLKMAKVIRRGEKDTYLGVCVGCNGTTSEWNCAVDVEISLINQSGKPDKSLKYSKTFCPPDLDWGWKSFFEWNELLNSDNGFLKDNTIVLVARIQLKNT